MQKFILSSVALAFIAAARHWPVMRRIAALMPALLLSGCLAAGALENVTEPPKDQPLVTGSLRVIENGSELKWPESYLAGSHFWLLILAEGASQAVSYRLGPDAEFYWALAPGKYHVLGFVKRELTRETSGRLWAAFTVPADAAGGAVYIGDLSIRLGGGAVDADVGDNMDASSAGLAEKYPGMGTPKWSLMKMIADQGSFSEIVEGCGGWGIDCNHNFQGVTPLRPMDGGAPSAQINSLGPTLEWAASKGDGSIRYDVVVFEEINFTYGLGAFSSKLPGPAVAYLQNLWAAQYTVAGPLKPGASYNWGVRLRRGDVVTAWSRFKNTGFWSRFKKTGFLSAGPSGPWFQFQTPGAAK